MLPLPCCPKYRRLCACLTSTDFRARHGSDSPFYASKDHSARQKLVKRADTLDPLLFAVHGGTVKSESPPLHPGPSIVPRRPENDKFTTDPRCAGGDQKDHRRKGKGGGEGRDVRSRSHSVVARPGPHPTPSHSRSDDMQMLWQTARVFRRNAHLLISQDKSVLEALFSPKHSPISTSSPWILLPSANAAPPPSNLMIVPLQIRRRAALEYTAPLLMKPTSVHHSLEKPCSPIPRRSSISRSKEGHLARSADPAATLACPTKPSKRDGMQVSTG